MTRNATGPPTAAVILTICLHACAGRFESLTERHARGPKMNPVAATFFGGDGIEEFVRATRVSRFSPRDP